MVCREKREREREVHKWSLLIEWREEKMNCVIIIITIIIKRLLIQHTSEICNSDHHGWKEKKKKNGVSILLTLQVCDPASWRLQGENQQIERRAQGSCNSKNIQPRPRTADQWRSSEVQWGPEIIHKYMNYTNTKKGKNNINHGTWNNYFIIHHSALTQSCCPVVLKVLIGLDSTLRVWLTALAQYFYIRK